jgi:hypothetical protein
MITAERVPHSGALVLTARVTDGMGDFYHSVTYYDYTPHEARAKYRESLTRDGLAIVNWRKRP